MKFWSKEYFILEIQLFISIWMMFRPVQGESDPCSDDRLSDFPYQCKNCTGVPDFHQCNLPSFTCLLNSCKQDDSINLYATDEYIIVRPIKSTNVGNLYIVLVEHGSFSIGECQILDPLISGELQDHTFKGISDYQKDYVLFLMMHNVCVSRKLLSQIRLYPSNINQHSVIQESEKVLVSWDLIQKDSKDVQYKVSSRTNPEGIIISDSFVRLPLTIVQKLRSIIITPFRRVNEIEYYSLPHEIDLRPPSERFPEKNDSSDANAPSVAEEKCAIHDITARMITETSFIVSWKVSGQSGEVSISVFDEIDLITKKVVITNNEVGINRLISGTLYRIRAECKSLSGSTSYVWTAVKTLEKCAIHDITARMITETSFIASWKVSGPAKELKISVFNEMDLIAKKVVITTNEVEINGLTSGTLYRIKAECESLSGSNSYAWTALKTLENKTTVSSIPTERNTGANISKESLPVEILDEELIKRNNASVIRACLKRNFRTENILCEIQYSLNSTDSFSIIDLTSNGSGAEIRTASCLAVYQEDTILLKIKSPKWFERIYRIHRNCTNNGTICIADEKTEVSKNSLNNSLYQAALFFLTGLIILMTVLLLLCRRDIKKKKMQVETLRKQLQLRKLISQKVHSKLESKEYSIKDHTYECIDLYAKVSPMCKKT